MDDPKKYKKDDTSQGSKGGEAEYPEDMTSDEETRDEALEINDS